MKFNRAGGILLHPTSLPGPYGIGDIGPEAHRWVDFLAETGTGLWQVLPLGPTGFGDSPYQCFSAFAGNYYLISPADLLERGFLVDEDLADRPDFPHAHVDFGAVIPWKLQLLDRAYLRFQNRASAKDLQDFEKFQDEQSYWLHEFALFMAIKEDQGGGPWVEWPAPLRNRQPEAIENARQRYARAIEKQKFRQYIFYRQWEKLHNHAAALHIQIIGDIPIFVAHDSAEVWTHPELFFLGDQGNPTVVAGVPPDYFSETGQLWGNPLYRWKRHREDGYQWWINRLRAVLQLVDIVRLDHFRGFAGYWEIPAEEETAVNGNWVPGPGKDFLEKLSEAFGELPIIAEDLGVITPDVIELREHFDLPSMRVLIFAFYGNPADLFLPHNYEESTVVYTGTHDNDTTLGWYKRVDELERAFARRYLARDGSDISWDMIRAAWASVAEFALAPMQDFLSLDNEARMNYPGNPRGNWTWRMGIHALDDALRARLKEYNYLYARSTLLETKEEDQAPEYTQPDDYFL